MQYATASFGTRKENYYLHAYGLSPTHGSEKGLGYIWLKELSLVYNVICFCELEFAKAAYKELEKKENCSALIVPTSIGSFARRCVWRQGSWSSYLFLEIYHIRTFLKSVIIARDFKPNVVHQFNMIGFRSPGYLCLLKFVNGSKVIWGPVGGLNTPPPAVMFRYGRACVMKQRIKNILNVVCLLLPSVLLWRMLSDKVFVSNAPTNLLLKLFFSDSIAFPETFGKRQFSEAKRRKAGEDKIFTILMIGKDDPRKLIINGLNAVNNSAGRLVDSRKIHLKLIGISVSTLKDLLEKKLDRALAKNLVVQAIETNLHGVLEELLGANLLLHMAIDEGTSHAVVEALSVGVRVLAFKTGGHLEYFGPNDKAISVPFNYDESVDSVSYFLEDMLKPQFVESGSLNDNPKLVFEESGVFKFLELSRTTTLS